MGGKPYPLPYFLSALTVLIFSYVYKNFYLLLLDSCWQTLVFTIFTSATPVLHNDIIIEATNCTNTYFIFLPWCIHYQLWICIHITIIICFSMFCYFLIVSIDTSVWHIYTLFFLFVYNTLPCPYADITFYVIFGNLLRIWCQYCLHEK